MMEELSLKFKEFIISQETNLYLIALALFLFPGINIEINNPEWVKFHAVIDTVAIFAMFFILKLLCTRPHEVVNDTPYKC